MAGPSSEVATLVREENQPPPQGTRCSSTPPDRNNLATTLSRNIISDPHELENSRAGTPHSCSKTKFRGPNQEWDADCEPDIPDRGRHPLKIGDRPDYSYRATYGSEPRGLPDYQDDLRSTFHGHSYAHPRADNDFGHLDEGFLGNSGRNPRSVPFRGHIDDPGEQGRNPGSFPLHYPAYHSPPAHGGFNFPSYGPSGLTRDLFPGVDHADIRKAVYYFEVAAYQLGLTAAEKYFAAVRFLPRGNISRYLDELGLTRKGTFSELKE